MRRLVGGGGGRGDTVTTTPRALRRFISRKPGNLSAAHARVLCDNPAGGTRMQNAQKGSKTGGGGDEAVGESSCAPCDTYLERLVGWVGAEGVAGAGAEGGGKRAMGTEERGNE